MEWLEQLRGQVVGWGAAAQRILELLLPQVVLAGLVKEIERLRPLALQQGVDLQILGCKI